MVERLHQGPRQEALQAPVGIVRLIIKRLACGRWAARGPTSRVSAGLVPGVGSDGRGCRGRDEPDCACVTTPTPH